MANYLHRHVYIAFLHHPMSIMVIDPVCRQATLPMRVTPFHSEMLCVKNIPSINGNDTLFCSRLNDTLFCSRLNGKHAGEGFRSLRFIVFEIC